MIGKPLINNVTSNLLLGFPSTILGLSIWLTTWYTVFPPPTCAWSNTVKKTCCPLSKSNSISETPFTPYKNCPAW